MLELVTSWRCTSCGWLPDLLAVLETESRMAPHRFHTVSLKPVPYDRATLLSKFEAALTSGKAWSFTARRTRDLAYELYLTRSCSHWYVKLAFDSDTERNDADLELIFATAERLAVAMRVDVGTLYPKSFAPVVNPVGLTYKTKAAHNPLLNGGLIEFGLTRMGARSFLGARVVELFGRETIERSECFGATLDRGILRLDLAARPRSLGRRRHPSLGDVSDPDVWSKVHDEGTQLLENIANVRVPMIFALEGRAHVHAEYGLLGRGASEEHEEPGSGITWQGRNNRAEQAFGRGGTPTRCLSS